MAISDRKKYLKEIRRIWQGMSPEERVLMLYLVRIAPPVSIDMLAALSGIPVVVVLNTMEDLIRKKIAFEKKETGRGFYFPKSSFFSDFIESETPREDLERIELSILDYYKTTPGEETRKTLALAEIYYRLRDNGEGLALINKAAHVLYASGDTTKAGQYFGYLLKNFVDQGVQNENAGCFIDNLPQRCFTAGELFTVEEQIDLLQKAVEVASRHKRSDWIAKITFFLAQVFREAGDDKKASECFDESWKISEKTGNTHILRMIALSVSDFLFWKGMISEAINRYEKAVGNLEEFGDDEATLETSARLGWCYVSRGRVSRGMGMIEAARSKAQSLGFADVVAYADLMSAISLIEIRRIAEAEPYLEKVCLLSPDILERKGLWVAYGLMSYVCCVKDEYDKAEEYATKTVEYDQKTGFLHQRGSFVFENFLEFEKRGLHYDNVYHDLLLSKALASNDIFMRGVALRYSAFKNLERRESKGRAFLDLRKSEKLLAKVGAEIELARTRIVLGDAYLKEGEINAALSYLETARIVLFKIDRNLFPKDLLVIMMPQEQKVEAMIDRVIDINESLGTIWNRSSFLERVLNVTMDFTMAMRGAFFVAEKNDEPGIIAGRNLDPLMLRAEQFKVIREVVMRAIREGREIVVPGFKDNSVAFNDALQQSGITSLICAPAKLGDHVHGYLYLDSKFGGGAFSEKQLPYVRLLCNQIAVGLSNIKIYEEMRGLKDRFEEEAIFYKKEMGIVTPTETIVGSSPATKHVIDQIGQVACTGSSVLITGETGVGKELVAKAIHNFSDRRNGPFIPVNLAALPQELVASELFGHEKGAFTGAGERHKGRFELANGGTIFLDEISDLPMAAQVKLLRVLQEGTFERLGGITSIRSDFRVVAATNKDLLQEVDKGFFRQDLYYRLNVFPINVPPLRDRKEDVPLLLQHFLEIFSRKMGKKVRRFSEGALKKMIAYRWPGNVRELEHFVERAVIVSDGPVIDFFGLGSSPDLHASNGELAVVSLARMEKDYIEKVLNAVHWKISGQNGAASILEMKPTTLLSRMKKLGIKRPPVEFYRHE